MICYHATGGCRKPIEPGSGVVVEAVYMMHAACAESACSRWGVAREDLRHVAWALDTINRDQKLKNQPVQLDVERVYKALAHIDCPFSRPLFPPNMANPPTVDVDAHLPPGDRT